jgi:hypothetical protein
MLGKWWLGCWQQTPDAFTARSTLDPGAKRECRGRMRSDGFLGTGRGCERDNSAANRWLVCDHLCRYKKHSTSRPEAKE